MKKRVLVVEDEIFVALDIEHMVESAGFLVSGIAADRASALAAAPMCDIALVDVNLRDGATGPDIARTLARDHGIRVIYVASNPAQIGADSVAFGVIPKPFGMTTIRAALQMAAGDGAACEGDTGGFTRFRAAAGSSPSPERDTLSTTH